MDLAADRGYPELIVQRERYWKELTPDERVKALQVGHAVYAEYNDVKGAERLNGLLRRVSTQVTGSHTGFVGTMGVLLGSGPFSAQITNPFRLQKTYQDSLWNTADYLRMKDLRWLGPDRMGRVTVGRLEAVPSPDQPKIPDSVAPSPGK